MIAATIAGGSALLWPLPPTVQIEEVTLLANRPVSPPRPEGAAPQRNKASSKSSAAAKQEVPAPVKHFPVQNTSLQRLAPPPRPGGEGSGAVPLLPPSLRPSAALPPRPPAENKK